MQNILRLPYRINRLMLFMEIIAVHCENHMKLINTKVKCILLMLREVVHVVIIMD
jgi:hypothetical protein